MALFDGITSASVYRLLGVLLVVSSLWLGVDSLYQGLTHPPTDLFFGIDTDILTGVWWLVTAVVWAVLYQRFVRHEVTVTD